MTANEYEVVMMGAQLVHELYLELFKNTNPPWCEFCSSVRFYYHWTITVLANLNAQIKDHKHR